MRIRLLSDLHLEHDRGHKHYDQALDELELDQDCDVLVLAGDIDGPSYIEETLVEINDRSPAPVLFVPGNHEFYNASHVEAENDMSLIPIKSQINGLSIMQNKVVTIGGQRFVGGTGWYDWAHPYMKIVFRNWSDSYFIYGLDAEGVSQDWTMFLGENLQEGDVVLSHMLPSYSTVSPEWMGDPNNCMFVNPADLVIKERKPKAWLHGHTHSSICDKIEDTEVHCNPRGYYPGALNPDFDKNLVLEI